MSAKFHAEQRLFHVYADNGTSMITPQERHSKSIEHYSNTLERNGVEHVPDVVLWQVFVYLQCVCMCLYVFVSRLCIVCVLAPVHRNLINVYYIYT